MRPYLGALWLDSVILQTPHSKHFIGCNGRVRVISQYCGGETCKLSSPKNADCLRSITVGPLRPKITTVTAIVASPLQIM